MLNTIISERQEAGEEKKRNTELESKERIRTEQMRLKIEKVRLEIESRQSRSPVNSEGLRRKPVFDLLLLMPRFDPSNSEINLYLVLFERQAQLSDNSKDFYASNLIGLLPYDVAQIIARENDDVVNDYEKVKQLLLRRLFFGGWINDLKIETFELIISDQIKRKVRTDKKNTLLMSGAD